MIPKFINKSKVSVTMSSDHYTFRERMYPFFDRVSRITIIRTTQRHAHSAELILSNREAVNRAHIAKPS